MDISEIVLDWGKSEIEQWEDEYKGIDFKG